MLTPTISAVYDHLPFSRGQWFIKFNVTMSQIPTQTEHFVRFRRDGSNQLYVKIIYHADAIKLWYKIGANPFVVREIVPSPVVNQIMDIEAKSAYNAQSGLWEWEAYLDGVRKVYETSSTSTSMNDVTFYLGGIDLGESISATFTDLKYSLTEPCGKIFSQFTAPPPPIESLLNMTKVRRKSS